MSPRDRLAGLAKQIGFPVTVSEDEVKAENVPCLLKGGVIGSCTIRQSRDPKTGKPDNRIGGSSHVVRITTPEQFDGCVYEVTGQRIENYIDGDGKTWSDISIHKGWAGSPEKDESAQDSVHRYANHIVGAAMAAANTGTESPGSSGPFKIPNTFEARAAIAPIQDRIRDQRVAIIGLGGTGAYVLDLLAKTPVSQIHLLDSDHLGWHTFMRAPGAPTDNEIKRVRRGRVDKVAYYHAKYGELRKGIHAHSFRVEDSAWLAGFLSEHSIDYVFVCIDQRTDSDSPRQDVVYEALTEAGVPFIDSGVSITIENDTICGSITTSTYSSGSLKWQNSIPNARVDGELPVYRNVQLPEVNALAAALALMEWRRRTGQYVSESTSFLHKFRIQRPNIVTPRADVEQWSP